MSFSQEVKDFLAGFNTTSEYAMKTQNLALDKQRTADDKAYKDANLDLDRQKLDLQKAAQGLRNKLALSANSRAAARLEMAKKAQEYKGLSALGADPAGNVDASAADEPDYSSDDEASALTYITEDTAMQARGGLVQTAAGGAMVGALPTEDDMVKRRLRAAQETAPAPAALPVENATEKPAAVTSASDDRSASAIPTAPVPLPREERAKAMEQTAPVPLPREERAKAERNAQIYAKAGEATELAMRSLKEDAAAGGGPDEAVPTGTAKKGEFDPATGKGAATVDEIKAIDSKIGGSFDGYTKGAARLAFAYQYFMDNGQIEKAANVAKRILLFDKQAAQTRGYLAQQALEQGDTASAAKLISDAYNENIPDGQELKTVLNPDGSVSYSVLKDGKVVSEGKANTEQLWSMAAKVKDGSEFLRRMATLAQSYSPMGSNGAFGKAQTAFVEANADFLSLQDKYSKASEAEKRAMADEIRKADKARRAAWREAQQVGSKYVKGKNEADVFKQVNDSLKAAVAAFGKDGAAPAPAAAPPDGINTLVSGYQAAEQQLAQLQKQFAALDRNSQSYEADAQAVMDQMRPLIEQNAKARDQIMQAAPQLFPGKNEGDLVAAVNELLTAQGGAALPVGPGPAPSPAAGPSQYSALQADYAAYNQQLSQISEKLAEINDPSNPEYQQLLAKGQPILAARDKVKAEIEKLAPTVIRGVNDAERASTVDANLKGAAGAPAALPVDFSSTSWKSPGGTLPQTADDVAKESALQKRLAAGEKITFKPLPATDIARVVDVIMTGKRDPNALIGKLIRDGFDPTGVAAALKEKGVRLSIDISGLAGAQ